MDRKKVISLSLGVTALCVMGVAFALDRAYPPNLVRYHDISQMVVDRNGQLLRAFLSDDDKWRLPARVGDIDPRYIKLLKAYEDQRYDFHPGVDPLAVLRAIGQWVSEGRVVSGASTLTMQTARLLEPRSRTFSSKLVEMARAVQFEMRYSKDDILAMYLTLAPFGGNVEGVRAASLRYFGKEPKHLTLSQAALLVALPQSPERLRPDRHYMEARFGRDKVLARMEESVKFSQLDLAEARNEALPLQRMRLPFLAPRLSQRLVSASGDAVVRTTLKAHMQKSLEDILALEDMWLEDDASIAAVIVENANRDVIAYAGGSDFWGPAGQIDLAQSPRSPGSTLKPFIYGLAFDDLLIHPETLIEDRPMVFGDYAPQNFDKGFQGTVTIRQALRKSLNVPAVALLDDMGPVRLAATLSHAGTKLSFARQGTAPSIPLALGGVGVTLLDLTQVYAGLANEGEVTPLKITMDQKASQPRRIMGKTAAYYIRDILSGSSMPDGWTQRAGFARRHTVAFKTGTSYGYRDAWAMGYTRDYTVGIWVGRADGAPRPGAFGRNTAAPLLLKVFDILPSDQDPYVPKPANVIDVADRQDLPLRMQHFERRSKKKHVAAITQRSVSAPVIKFPANGVAVALPDEDAHQGLALKAIGGAYPLRWMINGELLSQSTDMLADTYWYPEGPGYADVVVVDAAGRSATAHVQVLDGHE